MADRAAGRSDHTLSLLLVYHLMVSSSTNSVLSLADLYRYPLNSVNRQLIPSDLTVFKKTVVTVL